MSKIEQRPVGGSDTTISMPRAHLFGQFAALVTPFAEDGSVDIARLTAHMASLVDSVDGVTLFGTTGEGASLGATERAHMIDAAFDAGFSADRIVVCVAASDPETAENMVRAGAQRKIEKFLLTPPFYFKGIEAAGLEAWFTSLCARVSDTDARFILYHIPQVTGVAFAPASVRRLKDMHGDVVFGVKDSSGDWENAQSLLKMDDLAVMIGDERLMAAAAPLGCAGAITGMANIAPDVVGAMIRHGRASPDLDALVNQVVSVPVTPAVKALLGALIDDPGWARTRPPLCRADPDFIARIAPLARALRTK